ncbi:hypothetical protein CSUI_004672 [Cystoisospora suis]|uniref:Transmembrane protein n=1 Tax=Cystoisospora suis TaxID=483139 RepID=A0A2C6L0M3_9APIC|nr:hypothetical protein CSUI_004672 [Cystoisospora suis]
MMDDALVFPSSSDGETGGPLGVEASAHLAKEEPERAYIDRRDLHPTKKGGGSSRSEDDDKKSDNNARHRNRKRLRRPSTSYSFPYLRATQTSNRERPPVRRQHKRFLGVSLLVFSFVFLFTRHVIMKCGNFFSRTTGKHSGNFTSRGGGIPRLLASRDGTGEQQEGAHTPGPSPGQGQLAGYPLFFQLAQRSPQLLACLSAPPAYVAEEVDGEEDEELSPEDEPLELSVSGREQEGRREAQDEGMMTPDAEESHPNRESAAGLEERTEEESDGDEEGRRGIKRKKEIPDRTPQEREGNGLSDDDPRASKKSPGGRRVSPSTTLSGDSETSPFYHLRVESSPSTTDIQGDSSSSSGSTSTADQAEEERGQKEVMHAVERGREQAGRGAVAVEEPSDSDRGVDDEDDVTEVETPGDVSHLPPTSPPRFRPKKGRPRVGGHDTTGLKRRRGSRAPFVPAVLKPASLLPWAVVSSASSSEALEPSPGIGTASKRALQLKEVPLRTRIVAGTGTQTPNVSFEWESVWIDAKSLKSFEEALSPYLTILSTLAREAPVVWDQSLSVYDIHGSVRRAYFRLEELRTMDSAADAFRAMLLAEFYIGRVAAVSRMTGIPISCRLSRSLTVAQGVFETYLLKMGCPPASVCSLQSELMAQAGRVFAPLNAIGDFRASAVDKWRKTNEHLNAEQKNQAFRDYLATSLDSDVTSTLEISRRTDILPVISRWLDSQPAWFRHAVPPGSVFGTLLNPAQQTATSETGLSSSSSRTTSQTSDGDDARAASAGPAEEPHPGQQPLPPTATIPSLHGGVGGEDAPYHHGGQTFDEIVDFIGRYIDPESVPSADEPEESLRHWTEDVAAALGRQRAHLPVLVSKMHHARKRRSGVSPLLKGVATAYYRIAHARYALDRIPSLKDHAEFMKDLRRLESYCLLIWDRLGVYFTAAQWAQKGLVIVAMKFTYFPQMQPQTQTPFARLEAQLASLRRYWRQEHNDILVSLAGWMRDNYDSSIAVNVTANSRLFRAMYASGLRWRTIVPTVTLRDSTPRVSSLLSSPSVGSRTIPSLPPPAQEPIHPQQHRERQGEQVHELPRAQPMASLPASTSSAVSIPFPPQQQQRPEESFFQERQDGEDRRLTRPFLPNVVPSAGGSSSSPIVIDDENPDSPSSSYDR